MSYIINDEVIERIHEETNLVDIVSEYLPLKRTGVNFVGFAHFTMKRLHLSHIQTKQFYHCLVVEKEEM